MKKELNIEIIKGDNDIFRPWIIEEWKSHNEVAPYYPLEIIKPNQLKFARNEHNYQILVDGVMVGFVAIKSYKKQIYLYRLYIDPEHRSQGIGTLVMKWLVNMAEKLRKDISLDVFGENKAFNLYKKFGFVTQYRHMVLKLNNDNKEK